MNKLEKLLTEGNFAETLMKDGKFVEEAKKILNQETGEDISSQDLEKILSCIAENCTNPKEQNSELNEKELNEVVGGLSNRKLKTIITSSSTIIGSAIGGFAGFNKGPDIYDNAIVTYTKYKSKAEGDPKFVTNLKKGVSKVATDVDRCFSRSNKDTQELRALGAGAGAITGALGGAALGSLICKVTGL